MHNLGIFLSADGESRVTSLIASSRLHLSGLELIPVPNKRKDGVALSRKREDGKRSTGTKLRKPLQFPGTNNGTRGHLQT